MDTLASLRIFVAVAELKSFAAAAERLRLSPAMTTKHVQHLEARVGARLFQRTSRKVSLTEAGALYLAEVRPMLEGLAEAEARIGAATLEPRGTLRMSLPVWMAHPRFVRLFAAYRARYPQVRLDLHLDGRAVNLVEEGFDLALRITRSLDEGVIARTLAPIAFVLVAAPALLARTGRPERLADLDGLPFVAYAPMMASGRLALPGMDAEVRFDPVVLSGNETLLLMAAREGLGFAFVPRVIVEDDLAAGTLEHLLPTTLTPSAPLYAIYPNRTHLPAKVRTFLDFLVEEGW
nr:LysR family transcriptional regulator [Xanthobacter sp. YC-JY1]